MALRIKSRWHAESGPRSPDEIASALAYISWRLAKDKAINLHGQDFVYAGDDQRMAVIMEYLIFQLQIVDRLAEQRLALPEEERRALVIATARGMAKHVQDNSLDLFGPGDHIGPFIERLNARGAEYAEFRYTADGPSYPFMRHLGFEIQQIMGDDGENRWVIDQVMDRDGVEIDRQLKRALDDLFA